MIFGLSVTHFRAVDVGSSQSLEETEEIALMTGIREPSKLARILKEGISYAQYYHRMKREADRIHALVLAGFVFVVAIIITYMLNELVRRGEITVLGIFLAIFVLIIALSVLGLGLVHFHDILAMIKFEIMSDAEKKNSQQWNHFIYTC